MIDVVVLVIVDHLKIIASDIKEQLSDLRQIDFPTWVIHIYIYMSSNGQRMDNSE